MVEYAEKDAYFDRIRRLTTAAIEHGGTFYLPYSQRSYADLVKAYPNFPDFAKKKWEYDPQGVFGSSWWEKYRNEE